MIKHGKPENQIFSTISILFLMRIIHIAIRILAGPWKNQQSAYAKTEAQISFAVTAKMISAFVFATQIVQSFCFLNTKFNASSCFLLLHRPVCVGPVRKLHCWFPTSRLICKNFCGQIVLYIRNSYLRNGKLS